MSLGCLGLERVRLADGGIVEFSLEIDDASADQITTVGQAIEYISKSSEGQFQYPTTLLCYADSDSAH